MEDKVIDEKVVKELMRCGNYHGDNGCDYKQTSFGNYLYAINNIALYNLDGGKSDEYKQGRIDLAIEYLENLAKSCIDEENMTIHYDPKKEYMYGIGSLMPYVIHYVALKMGLDLAPEHKDYCTQTAWNSSEKVDLKLVKCEPVNDKQMACSVIITVTENNDYLIKNGKIVKGGENSIIRENEKLINLMAYIVEPKDAAKEQDKTK